MRTRFERIFFEKNEENGYFSEKKQKYDTEMNLYQHHLLKKEDILLELLRCVRMLLLESILECYSIDDFVDFRTH